VSADPLHDVFGDQPVEFAIAGKLADLTARLPSDTPVVVAHAIPRRPEPGPPRRRGTHHGVRAHCVPRATSAAPASGCSIWAGGDARNAGDDLADFAQPPVGGDVRW
jgi:hypothetical protein